MHVTTGNNNFLVLKSRYLVQSPPIIVVDLKLNFFHVKYIFNCHMKTDLHAINRYLFIMMIFKNYYVADYI